jgi:uncharacterized protein (DUF433 family)
MQEKRITHKSRAILKGIADGRSCEQILADDRTLTYHDIFHAVTEAPTRLWKKKKPPANKPLDQSAT